MNRCVRPLVALLASTLAVCGASAATISLNGVVIGDPDTNVLSPVAYPSTPVGALMASGNITGAPGYSLLTSLNLPGYFSFCIELGQDIVVGPAGGYTVVNPSTAYFPGPLNGWGSNAATAAAISSRVDLLMSYGLSVAASANDFGALQLALWEVIYDFGLNPLDLGTGNFQATPSVAAVSTQAASFISNSASYLGPVTHFLVATDPANQDLLVVPELPEPSTLALLAVSLSALALFSRRT